ncbi:MAG: hypothetical protein VKP62_08120 [Candidatus Sericytochromatia bacterium]|nr:hypothetical protein [Candidatus Sericytochromatia bacterium]
MEKTQSPNPDSKEAIAEAQRQLEEVRTQLSQATKGAQETISRQVQAARQRVEVAQADLQQAREVRERLEGRREEPGIEEHFQRMSLLEKVHAATETFASVELAVWERNAQQLAAIPAGEDPAALSEAKPLDLRIPVADLDYLTERTLLDVALLEYHWYRNRAGIDVVLRASGNAFRAHDGSEDEQEAAAAALKQAMGADQDLTIAVGRLSAVFEEAFALLDWGQAAGARLRQMPAAARQTALEDADWNKLNGSLLAILELRARYEDHPALGPLFGERD